MTYIFLFYVFLSIVCITGGAYYFYSSNHQLTAYIYFVGSIAAVIFFGLRWFSPSGDITKAASGAWPPSINYCPDFMSLAVIEDEQVCIDTIGVAQNGGLAVSDGTQVNDRYVFHLFTDKIGKERVNLLCEESKSKQVTWEGVWDGTVCMGKEPPKPPTPETS